MPWPSNKRCQASRARVPGVEQTGHCASEEPGACENMYCSEPRAEFEEVNALEESSFLLSVMSCESFIVASCGRRRGKRGGALLQTQNHCTRQDE